MTKKFSEYLHRALVQFLCKDMSSERDSDRRLYILARLQTVSDRQRMGWTCIETADLLNRDYLHDIANGEPWWRS